MKAEAVGAGFWLGRGLTEKVLNGTEVRALELGQEAYMSQAARNLQGSPKPPPWSC